MMMASAFSVYAQTQPAGSGTPEDPFRIGTAAELKWFADYVNGKGPNQNVILTNDIDYSAYSTGMDMIGNGNINGSDKDKAFKGTFDGDGYKITVNFNFGSGDSYGLFGFVSGNPTIENLTVDGSLRVEGSWWHVGGIVGSDSNVANTVVTMSNCKSDVQITTIKSNDNVDFVTVGGVIGVCQRELQMDLCSFTGKINSTVNGNNWNRMVIIGGLVGSASDGKIQNSYVYLDSEGDMTITQNQGDKYIYPILGNRKSNGNNYSRNVTTTNCYCYYEDISFTDTSNSRNNQTTHPNSNSREPFSAWPTSNIYEQDLDKILAGVDKGATQMSIYTTADMQRFANAVNGGNRTLKGHLRRCIEFNGTVGVSDHKFAGLFDGNNHTITINRNGDGYGLFDYTDNAVIQNLNITGVISGNQNLGGFIYRNVNSQTKLINCVSSVRFVIGFNASAYVGGLVYRTTTAISFDHCAFIGSFEGKGATSRCHGFLASDASTAPIVISNSYSNFKYIGAKGTQFCQNEGASDLTLTNSYSTDKTPEQYASGEVCYLLNGSTSETTGPWYQNIGTEPNPVHAKCSCPEHAGENMVVYQNALKACPGQKTPTVEYPITYRYDNVILPDNELYVYPYHNYAPDHDGVHVCSVCGSSVHLIYDAETLQNFADAVISNPSLDAVVVNDIIANSNTTIGTQDEPYSGVFDGGYNTIKINRTASENYTGGLFGTVSGAVIKNLIVEGTIKANGRQYIGGIVGSNITRPLTMDKCISTVTIETNKMTSNTTQYIGGIIGYSEVANWSMKNCAFAGKFILSGTYTSWGRTYYYKASYCNGFVAAGQRGAISDSYVFANVSSSGADNNLNNINTSYCYTFAQSCDLTNSYYGTVIGNGQGITLTSDVFSNTSNTGAAFKLNRDRNNIAWYAYGTGTGLGYQYPTIVGYVWQGSDASTDWTVGTNWKKGIAPTTTAANPAYTTITIPAVGEIGKTYPHISTSADINSVDIMPMAEMHVEAADITVNIDGTVNNKGTFAINYGDSYTAVQGSPNVLISGASPINVTVKRHLLPRVTYYAGSATAEGTIQEGYDYAANGDYLAFFDAATQKFDTSLRSVGRFPAQYIGCTVGLGSYDASSFTQIGTVHNTDAMLVPLKAGYNWLSNPYPYSAMAWDNESNKGLIPQNTGANMSPTVWVRKNNGGSGYIYTTYNAKVGISAYGPGRAYDAAKYIAPFQDYCILVNNAGTYEINGVLAKDDGSVVNSKLKSAQIEMPMDVVRLNVITNGKDDIDDQAVVVLREDGILGASNLDSNKYPTSSYSQIAVYKAGSNNKYAIGLYPSIDDVEGEEIPVNVTAVSGAKQLTIAADLSALAEGYDIILIDHATVPQTEVNLRLEQGYIFAASGLTAKRFGIVVRRNDSFQDSSVEDSGTSTNVVNIETKGRFVAYSMNENIIVELGSSDLGNTIQVVDLAGRVVTMIKQGKHYNVLPMTQAGIYIVVVGDQSQKVMVK